MLRNTLVLVLSATGLFAVACSDAAHPVQGSPEGGPTCPTTVESAPTTKCSKEGFACTVGYGCPGGVWQQAQCTCAGGTFNCIDATGAEAGTAPACAPLAPTSDKCGATLADVDNKACVTAGFTCTYAGAACPNGKAAQDTCVCFPAEVLKDGGGGALTFSCTPGVCPSPQ